jgi:hypothetical protein
MPTASWTSSFSHGNCLADHGFRPCKADAVQRVMRRSGPSRALRDLAATPPPLAIRSLYGSMEPAQDVLGFSWSGFYTCCAHLFEYGAYDGVFRLTHTARHKRFGAENHPITEVPFGDNLCLRAKFRHRATEEMHEDMNQSILWSGAAARAKQVCQIVDSQRPTAGAG